MSDAFDNELKDGKLSICGANGEVYVVEFQIPLSSLIDPDLKKTTERYLEPVMWLMQRTYQNKLTKERHNEQ